MAVAYGATLLGAVPHEGEIWAARAERYASAELCEVVPFRLNADGRSIVAELFFRIVAVRREKSEKSVGCVACAIVAARSRETHQRSTVSNRHPRPNLAG